MQAGAQAVRCEPGDADHIARTSWLACLPSARCDLYKRRFKANLNHCPRPWRQGDSRVTAHCQTDLRSGNRRSVPELYMLPGQGNPELSMIGQVEARLDTLSPATRLRDNRLEHARLLCSRKRTHGHRRKAPAPFADPSCRHRRSAPPKCLAEVPRRSASPKCLADVPRRRASPTCLARTPSY